MLQAGLNLTGYGACFDNELRNGQVENLTLIELDIN